MANKDAMFFSTGLTRVFLLPVYRKAIDSILKGGAYSDVSIIVICVGDAFFWELEMLGTQVPLDT